MEKLTEADSQHSHWLSTDLQRPFQKRDRRIKPARSMSDASLDMLPLLLQGVSPRLKMQITKKLCDFCHTTIILSEEKSGLHHRSAEDLEQSSQRDDCRLCSQLWKDVRDHHDSFVWPLHRWNIRGPQKIGDTDDVYATLVFRQTVSMHASSDNEGENRVPERSFLLFQQSDSAQIQSSIPHGDNTFSLRTQEIMHKWLKECSENHSACQKRADANFMPTRLLDLGRGEKIYCVETREVKLKAPYVTLSYAWGARRFFTLLPSNRQMFVDEGVPGSILPRTIQEAIQITRALGVRYIWIDSLCIMQGPDGDFMQEGSLMLYVYRNALANLAATDSTGADVPMSRYRDPAQLVDAQFQGSPNSAMFGNSVWRVVPKTLWDEEVLASMLNTRAWVFQERLLSPRLLHFTRTQVFWDCATMSACETFPDGLPLPLDTGSNDRYWRWKLQDTGDLNTFLPRVIDDSLERFWRSAIKTYSACNLTRESDRLIAIWGIVGFLISALKETYAVGLWERNLEEQLAWHVIPSRRRIPSERSEIDAPTWSWARADGVIELPDRFAAVRDYQVTDHDGKRIAFRLANSPEMETAKSRGPHTWKEQLAEYDYRLRKMDEIRKQGYEQKPRAKTKPPVIEVIPPLQTHAIEIQGHVGAAFLRRVRSSAAWTFEMPLLPPLGADIEVFPDVDPVKEPNEKTLFLLLAMSRSPIENPVPNTVQANHYVDIPETYEGIGLLIEQMLDTDMHFVRKGAFRFRGVSLAALQNAFSVGTWQLGNLTVSNGEQGHKIWLC